MEKRWGKDVLTVLFDLSLTLFSVISLTFGLSFLKRTDFSIIKQNASILLTVFSVIMFVITVLFFIFKALNLSTVYKTLYLCCALTAGFAVLFYILQITGFFSVVRSVEDLRQYVLSFDAWAIPVFILVQILQVAVIPIPGVITIGAGVLLFGAFKGAIISSVGIILGSIIAFFIGRIFGYPVCRWLVGKDELDRVMKSVKGKDKILLTFMFVFPFFPDDVLCFVAGLSTMSGKYFTVMIVLVRMFSTFICSYSINGSIIPYTTWWGILIWATIFVGSFLLCAYVYKNGDKISAFFKKRRFQK